MIEGVGIALTYWSPDDSNWRSTGPGLTSGYMQLVGDTLLIAAQVRNSANADPALVRKVEMEIVASVEGGLQRIAEDPWDCIGLVGLTVPLSAISAVSCWQLVVTKAALLDRKSKALIAERGYGTVNAAGISVEFSDGWRPLTLELRLPEFPGDQGAAGVTDFASTLARSAASSRLEGAAGEGASRQSLEAVLTGSSPLTQIRTPPAGTKLGEEGYLVQRVDLPGSLPLSVEVRTATPSAHLPPPAVAPPTAPLPPPLTAPLPATAPPTAPLTAPLPATAPPGGSSPAGAGSSEADDFEIVLHRPAAATGAPAQSLAAAPAAHTAAAVQPPTACSQCAQPYEEGQRFCASCGSALA